MARRSRRTARDAYDRWVQTEDGPQSTPGRRLQASRHGQRKGQRKLAQKVAEALRAPAHGLLDVLNLAAQYQPGSADRARAKPLLRARALDTKDPTRLPAATPGLVRGWLVLEELALTLILEAGEHTAVAEAAWLHALRTLDADRETVPLTGLALALWGQPREWRRRLRHCDHPGCAEPYFLARTHNRRDRYCMTAHEQPARRLRTRVRRFSAAIPPGRLASPPRSSPPLA
jgi:hypothetical protein